MLHQHSPAKRRAAALAGLVGMASITALQLTGASGAAVTSHSTKTSAAKTVKPDLSYFAGKTITFINGSSPGSGGDSYARPLAPYIQKYLGAAAVNVQNITGSGSIAAQDTVAAAAPNGLTIGELTAVSNYEGYIGAATAVNFNQAKMTILGGTYLSAGSSIFARSNAPDQTWAAFVKDKAVHTMGDIVPGAVDMETRSLLWAYRIPTVLVTGYSSTSGLAQGFARGDEPYATSAVTAFIPNLQTGVAKCLLVLADTAPATELSTSALLKGCPTVPQYVAKNPPATKQGKAVITELEAVLRTPPYDFFAPKGLAPGVALALQDAVKYAESQTEVKETYVADGNVPGYTPAATVLADLNSVSKHISVLKAPVSSVG